MHHSIDRIDGARDYEPNNCRWATTAEQGANKSTTILNEEAVVEIRASDASPADLAKRFGVSRSTIYGIRSGQTWKHVP